MMPCIKKTTCYCVIFLVLYAVISKVEATLEISVMAHSTAVPKTMFVGTIALANLVLPLGTVRQASIVVMQHVP